jgi:hypothetical protein
MFRFAVSLRRAAGEQFGTIALHAAGDGVVAAIGGIVARRRAARFLYAFSAVLIALVARIALPAGAAVEHGVGFALPGCFIAFLSCRAAGLRARRLVFALGRLRVAGLIGAAQRRVGDAARFGFALMRDGVAPFFRRAAGLLARQKVALAGFLIALIAGVALASRAAVEARLRIALAALFIADFSGGASCHRAWLFDYIIVSNRSGVVIAPRRRVVVSGSDFLAKIGSAALVTGRTYAADARLSLRRCTQTGKGIANLPGGAGSGIRAAIALRPRVLIFVDAFPIDADFSPTAIHVGRTSSRSVAPAARDPKQEAR